MHQIRIHLAKNETPIAGDDKYGNFKINKLLKKHMGIKKLHLAAVQLTIPSRFFNSSQDNTSKAETPSVFSIPLPIYMQKIAKISGTAIDITCNNIHHVGEDV